MKIERIKSIIRVPLRRVFLLIPLVFASLAVPWQARAVCQQGCDGSNGFLGEGALIANTTGTHNTAIGWQALFNNMTGSSNTANGVVALWGNTKVEEQETTISQLRSLVAQQQKDFQMTVAQLTARLDHQATQIQEVSAQFESRKPALQVVNKP